MRNSRVNQKHIAGGNIMYWFKEDEAKDLNKLRTAYKKLLIKYHPDNNLDRDTTKELQEINSEYDKLFERLKNSFETSKDYENASSRQKQAYDWEKDYQMRTIIMSLSNIQDIVIEIIGTWIWVSGNTYPHRKTLKELGLHYCKKKSAWSIHFDDFYRWSNSEYYSLDDIRSKYGSVKIKNVKGHEKLKPV